MDDELEKIIKEAEAKDARHPKEALDRMYISGIKPTWYYEVMCGSDDGDSIYSKESIYRIVDKKVQYILEKHNGKGPASEDMRLMSAAPDLYYACLLSRKLLVGLLDDMDFKKSSESAKVISEIDFAFSKVKGY